MLLTPSHEPAASRVRLGEDEVHLWWGAWDSVESLDAIRGSLSDEEWRRGERFRRERDARAFLFRRAFLRRVLAAYTNVDPRVLPLATGAHGKPFLSPSELDLRFSATSAGTRALIAVARGRELGVDLEGSSRLGGAEGLSLLVPRVLTAGERLALEALPPEARTSAFLRAWTRKEAVLKALGTGFTREPAAIEVGIGELAGPGASCARAWEGWGRAHDLDAPAGHVASLVVADPDASLELRPRAWSSVPTRR